MKYLIIKVHILTTTMAMAMGPSSHQSQHQDGTNTDSSINSLTAAEKYQEILLQNTYKQIGHQNNGKCHKILLVAL
jgi:hypothetical protein